MPNATSPRPSHLRLLLAALLVAASMVAVSAPTSARAASSSVSLRGSSRSYAVFHNRDGSVVRWNPCKPIGYRVNLRYAPRGALADVRVAIARTSAATGLRFVYGGATTVIPQATYGTTGSVVEPPPVVIAWAAPGRGIGHSNTLTGSAQAGDGGWVSASWTDSHGHHKPRIITGYVVLNTSSNRLPAGFAAHRTGSRGMLLMHELGHVVGLGHTSSRSQIMYPVLTSYPATWGAGDAAGLRLVGRAYGCIA